MDRKFEFQLFADYYQFYLKDETASGDLSGSWTPEAVDRLLAVAPGTIGIGTVRNTTVPVLIEVLDGEPEATNDIWDKINDCTLDVPSGRIVVAGCTDYVPDAARIEVTPRSYRVRIYYANLKAIATDGLSGDDQYRVILWP